MTRKKKHPKDLRAILDRFPRDVTPEDVAGAVSEEEIDMLIRAGVALVLRRKGRELAALLGKMEAGARHNVPLFADMVKEMENRMAEEPVIETRLEAMAFTYLRVQALHGSQRRADEWLQECLDTVDELAVTLAGIGPPPGARLN